MNDYKIVKRLLLVFIIIVLFFSCTTFNRRNPYPNMEIAYYANSQAYVFPNEASDKLIIVIDGSGWESVLGEKKGNTWKTVGLAAIFLQELNHRYAILVLEKLKRQPGIVYFEDIEDRANYTAENLVACYTESINNYLTAHVFSSIVLIGSSEGAALLPLVYERMDNKENVTAMVSMAFGGLSWYESNKILSVRSDIPQGWSEMYFGASYIFRPENKAEDNEFMNSFEEDYFGFTFRYFTSFFHIRPFDYYKNIDIPVLFVHGKNDYNVPVESTMYVQEHLPDKPFEYKYYEWEHGPGSRADTLQFRKDIAEWILSL